MQKHKFMICIVILCTMFVYIYNITQIYATTESENGISVGEQQPPAKPPTTKSTEQNNPTPESPDKDDNKNQNHIIIEEQPDPVYYTITFDTNGGIGTIPDITVLANSPIPTIPKHVKRQGYDFIGWYTEYGNPITTNTLITDNITAIAKWKPNGSTPYTIIQKTQKLDGSYEIHQTIKQTDNPYVTRTIQPEPIKGFHTPPSQTITIQEDGSSSITFEYTRKKYKINITTKTGVINKQKTFTYYYDEPVNLNLYLEEDYTNLTLTGDVKSKNFKMPDKNVNITATAKPTIYKITYKGQFINTSELTKKYSIETLPILLTAPTITNKFYQFNGWIYDGKPIDQITNTSHTDMIIKANISIKWNKLIPYLLLLIPPTTCLYFCITYKKRRKRKHAIMDNNASDTLSTNTQSE